jgi:Mg/Co/Ni transporter MgtE
MSDKISEEKRTEIEELLNEWLKIDSSEDMLLIQYRKIKKESLNVDYTILFIVLLFIVLISALMIKSGFAYLASALKRVKVAEFGNTLHIKGDVTSPRASGGGSGLSNLHFSQNKPLPISVIDNPSDDLETQGFDFVENLSVKNFLTLVDDESDDNIALILSKLDATYSARIIEEMQDKARNITVSLSVNNPRSQKVVKEFRNRLYEKYSKFEEDRDYKVNGIETLISIINNLPAKESADLFEQIKADNGQAAGEIRKSIFLLDDIFELSNDVIKALMKTLHHDLLVKFLAQNESSFREVFFRNMTERSISIIQEDIELNSDFSESEKADSTNEMLMTIRKILNYN